MIELPVIQYLENPITIPDQASEMLADPNCKILVAFSGGKDSVAMVLYLLEMGIDKGRIELHHHEVDGGGLELFDWGCTTSYCQAFADAFDLKIYFSYREGGIIREMYRENEGLQDVILKDNNEEIRFKSRKGNSSRKKFPAISASLMTRWCSSVVKIDVLSRIVNNLYKEGRYLVLTGERREESKNRSGYEAIEKYRSHTKKRDIWQWRPVIDFKEEDVWALYEKYKVQAHPCYELGWSRCSCQLCIFSSPNTWASLNELVKDKVDFLISVEEELDHTMHNKKTLKQVVEKGVSFLSAEVLKRWKDEALGEFISPIIVEGEWQLPRGAYGEEKSGSL
jgi:3'-phosphoadenosine 5'-phosphosulfate sulfotransferase (PAPS reductase)/FAD synthetase